MKYILGIDQSTQGTKAILVDGHGAIAARADRSHRQIINEQGWVSHDLEEIYGCVLEACRDVIENSGVDKSQIAAIGISNQRETSAMWDSSGKPLNYAVVWQCARAAGIAGELREWGQEIRERTGLELSPYFPAAKLAWLLRNTQELPPEKDIRLGTIDAWLIYKLTKGGSFMTDYSNASRTQLFNIHDLKWDAKVCDIFKIPVECLPQVIDSDGLFGMTDLDGLLDKPVPIHGAAGDSHAALFAQGCHKPGMIKATYGTGSSVMMNTGDVCVKSGHGLVTSLAWGVDGRVDYVLEGNINYTGAVISWLRDDVELIDSPSETEALALEANPEDSTVLVPAFSGLSAPYWVDNARAMLWGMTRTTGKKEIAKAALESIALQINAVFSAMEKDSGQKILELRADGGATSNRFLMQAQSDFSDVTVAVSPVQELSALGAAYMAGLGADVYDMEDIFRQREMVRFSPKTDPEKRRRKLEDWDRAVAAASAC